MFSQPLNWSTMSIVIETKELTRVYQTYVKPEGLWNSIKGFWARQYNSKMALSPTDLSIEGGQIVGLVGANGAGKTTLLKLLSGLIYPSAGSASVLGYSPWSRSTAYLRRISILLGQKNQLWWDLPPSDSFNLLARIYDIDFQEVQKRVLSLAELLSCRELLQVQLRRLSLGERMKMEIIGSLLHKPDVLFLDEPTIGLDIVAQTNIREFLSEYVRTENPTVILTSHYMDDISRLSNRLLLISQGAIVYDGTVKSFMQKAEALQQMSLRLQSPLSRPLEINHELVLPAGSENYSLELPENQIATVLQKIMSVAQIQELKVNEANFEDVIRKFMEKEPRLRQARNPVAT